MCVIYLLQSLFPAVGLITEGALELLGHSSVGWVAARPLDVPLAHLLLEVLLETSFVSELSGAVGALQRAVSPIVSSLQMIIEEPLLSEVFVATLADEGPLPGVDPVVDIEMRFPRIGLLAYCAHERLLALKTYHREKSLKRGLCPIIECSPVCMRMCSSRELLSLQAFSQTPHMKLDTLV